MKKLILISLILSSVLVGCSNAPSNIRANSTNRDYISDEASNHVSNFVSIKYRSDSVDIADPRFKELNTSKSSFVRGAWYDSDNEYMVIKLDDTYYHYCGMPQSAWRDFKKANSFGTKYIGLIKENYDCRIEFVPDY